MLYCIGFGPVVFRQPLVDEPQDSLHHGVAPPHTSPHDEMSERPRFFYGWVIVAIALMLMAVGYTLRNTFSVFYPVLVDEFAWERGSTALMFSINIVVYGIAAPIAGGLVDRFNPRFVLSLGVCIMGGAIALCSMATQQWQFYLLYGAMAATGLSMAGVTPLSALIARWFIRRRALAFGIFNMGFGLSLLASPIAQSLISNLGRQQAYLTMGLAAIAIAVPIIVILVRRTPEDKQTTPDGVPVPAIPSEGSAQALMETAWMRTRWTLRRAMATRQFWLMFGFNLCLMGLSQQVIIAHSVYLFRDNGFAPQLAASSFGFYGVGITIGYLMANLSDRYGRERILIPSCLAAAAATSLLFFINHPSQAWLAFISMFFCGLGMGAAVTTFFATVADLFQGPSYGAIQGFMVMGFSIGGAFSPWFAGYMHDLTGTYAPAVTIAVAALVTGALLVALIAPSKLRPVARLNALHTGVGR